MAVTNKKDDVSEAKEVCIIVPKDPLNKDDAQVRVGINGRFWTINKEVQVSVPIGVYTLLQEAGYNPSVQLDDKE